LILLIQRTRIECSDEPTSARALFNTWEKKLVGYVCIFAMRRFLSQQNNFVGYVFILFVKLRSGLKYFACITLMQHFIIKTFFMEKL
jgi:hypothetical protein